jgi:hypothetical protein
MSDLHDIEFLHAFKVDLVPATNYKGTRVSIRSLNFDNDKITVPYKYEFDTILGTALTVLNEKGFNIIGWADAGVGEGYLILSDTFKRLKK